MHDAWPAGDSEMAQLVRAHDWSATPLGPIAGWSQRMRAVIELVLAHGFPMSAQFGPTQISIYNDAYRPILGHRHPATLGRPLYEAWPEVRDANEPRVARVRAGETINLARTSFTTARHGALEDACYDLTMSPLRDETGIAGVLVTVFDITERVRAEQARARVEADLRASEERQTYLLKLSDALRSLVDPAEIQAEAMRMLREHVGALRAQYQVAERSGASVASSHDGTCPGAELRVPLVKDGNIVATLELERATTRAWTRDEIAVAEQTADRTWVAIERARAEALRHASEAQLAAAFEAAPMGFSVLDRSGQVVRMNHEMRRYLPTGVMPSRDPDRRPRWGAWNADGARIAARDFPAARALRGERVVPGIEMLYEHDDGTKAWTSVSAVPLRDDGGNVIGAFAIVRDIDLLKRTAEALRESEENLRAVFDTMQEGFRVLAVVRDPGGAVVDHRTVMSNAAAARQVDLPLQATRDAVARVVETGAPIRLELHAAPGAWFDVRIYAHGIERVAVISEDITARKEAELGLAGFARERETLLEELHHRVKNNLGVIDSLLQLQADSIDNGEARVALLEASNRVHAIAEAHRLLYETGGFASVDLRAYVTALARALYDGMVLDHERITLALDAEPVALDLRRAVPLGLLLNEVLTNAFQHAFPDGRGVVAVALREQAAWIELAVTDDGAGFAVPRRAATLGIKLVHVLAEQLRGTVTIDTRRGTVVRLRLPA